ncbi:MAG: hypothetical protein AB9922_12310 [Bacteroidales bacterium]
MDEIRNWLSTENPDFDQGFQLLSTYSRNLSLIHYIGRKRQMEMLKYELQKMASTNAVLKPNPHALPKVSTYQAPSQRVVILDERKVNREDLPEEMKAVYDQIVEGYKELRILHEKMKLANSDAGRVEFREKIILVDSKIKSGWKIIDTGKFPEDPAGSSKINSARAYISKMLKKDELAPAQRELMKEKINIVVTAGETFKPEILQKLKEKGF